MPLPAAQRMVVFPAGDPEPDSTGPRRHAASGTRKPHGVAAPPPPVIRRDRSRCRMIWAGVSGLPISSLSIGMTWPWRSIDSVFEVRVTAIQLIDHLIYNTARVNVEDNTFLTW